jgi:hypothetical protein
MKENPQDNSYNYENELIPAIVYIRIWESDLKARNELQRGIAHHWIPVLNTCN